MAKRKQKTELETTSFEQQNNEVIEDNKINETISETTNNKNVNKNVNENVNENVNRTIKEKEYIITKKPEGVYIRKLRRL